MTKADFEDFLADMQALGIQRHPKSTNDFVCGVIEDVVRGSKSFWAVRGNHRWVLGQARRSAPRKRAGQLGFFKV